MRAIGMRETAQEENAEADAPAPKSRLRRWLKAGLKPLWRLVRPLARPLLWRLRGFLVAPLLEEVAELRKREEELSAALRANGEAVARLTALYDTLAHQAEVDARTAEALEEMSGALETALLNIALAPPSEGDDHS